MRRENAAKEKEAATKKAEQDRLAASQSQFIRQPDAKGGDFSKAKNKKTTKGGFKVAEKFQGPDANPVPDAMVPDIRKVDAAEIEEGDDASDDSLF